jgi:hypothetical protein
VKIGVKGLTEVAIEREQNLARGEIEEHGGLLGALPCVQPPITEHVFG